MRKLIGKCGVDSGQLIITDPCYLKDWKNNDFSIGEEYKLEAVENIEFTAKNGVEMKISKGKKFKVVSTKGIWFDIVEYINNKKLKVLDRKRTNMNQEEYSYNGACSATLSEKKAGFVGYEGQAVAMSTGYGDGSYSVYATYNKERRIKKVEIIFIDEE